MSKTIAFSLTEVGDVVTFNIKRPHREELLHDAKLYHVFVKDPRNEDGFQKERIGLVERVEKGCWQARSMRLGIWHNTSSRNEAVKHLAQAYMKQGAPDPEWLLMGPKGKRLPTRFTEMKIEVLNAASISEDDMQHLRDLIAYAWAVHVRGDGLGPAVRLDMRSFKVSADICTSRRTFAIEALLDFMESIPGYIREGSPHRIDPMPLPFNVELYVK